MSPPTERPLPLPAVVGILIRFAATRTLLRVLGLRRTCLLLRRLSDRPHPLAGSPSDLQQLSLRQASRVVEVNRRYSLPGATCLVESLTLWWLLRRSGISGDFRLGVRLLTGRFESHAWVEHEGRVLNDEETTNRLYTPIGPVLSALRASTR